jgi:hypothetical protein
MLSGPSHEGPSMPILRAITGLERSMLSAPERRHGEID